MRRANSAAVSPEEDEDFQGVELGGSVAQVARLGERRAGERAFRDAFRPRVRQPAHENRGIPAPYGEAIRPRAWLEELKVASPTDAKKDAKPV